MLGALVVLGCQRDAPPAPVEAPSPVVAIDLQADTATRIRALGAGAAIVLVVDPREESWTHAREKILAVKDDVAAELAITKLDDPVLAALRVLGISVEADDGLQGWDRERRVVLAMGDPLVVGPPGLPSLRMMEPGEVRLRHVIALPASDVEVLVASLDRALESAGEPWPALVAGIPGARGRMLRGRGAVALMPDTDAVRIVAITHAELREPAADLDAFIADLQAPHEIVEDTPALELAARPELGLAVYVRPWRLRVLLAMLGMRAAHLEVSRLEPWLRHSALAAGLHIVLGCEGMLSEPREVDDWTIGLVADGSRAMLVGGLTQLGHERIGGPISPVEPLALRREDLIASLFIAAIVTPPPSLASDRDLEACGRVAPRILAMGLPSTWVSRVAATWAEDEGLGSSIAEILRARPLGLQVSVVPTAKGNGASLAVMLSSFEEAQHLVVELERRGARAFVAPRGTEHVVLAGFGVDPNDVYALDVAGRRQGAFAVELRQEGLPFTRGRMEVVDGIVFGEVSGPERLFGEPISFTTQRRVKGPAIGEADRDALECLRRAEAVIVPALQRLNEPHARHSTSGPMEWFSRAADDIECASSHPETKEAMGLVAGYAASEAITALLEIGEVAEATRLLSIRCKTGKSCDAWASASALPQVSLSRVAQPMTCVEKTFNEPFGVPVLIADGRIAIAGEPVRAERAALVAALERARPPAPRVLTLDLLIDRDVEPSTVAPVLEAMVSMGIDIVNLGSMSEHGFVGMALYLKRATRTNLPSQGTWEDFATVLGEYCELATVHVAYEP